jgi:hypothetical protein
MIFVDNLLEHRWKILAGRQLRNSVDEKEWKFLQKKNIIAIKQTFWFLKNLSKKFCFLKF